MTDPEMSPFATLAIDSHIAIVTLNRPDKHNAMNLAKREELHTHLSAVRDDSNVRVVLLAGAGASFSSGQDLKERSGLRPIESAEAKWAQEDFQGLLERIPQPIIAAIRGYCFGRGIEVALTCDLRIASTTAKIRFPEVTLA